MRAVRLAKSWMWPVIETCDWASVLVGVSSLPPCVAVSQSILQQLHDEDATKPSHVEGSFKFSLCHFEIRRETDYEDGCGYARQANMPDEKSGDHINRDIHSTFHSSPSSRCNCIFGWRLDDDRA